MKKMMLLLSLALSACASANQPREISSMDTNKSSHIRFWRGFKQDDLSQQQFQQNLIQKLIPATVHVGQNKGLISYAPVFPKEVLNGDVASNFIPDEIAFIQYADEETYKKLSSTPDFKDYGKMHYEPGAFIKKNAQGFSSGSLVSRTIREQESISFTNEAFAIDFGQTITSWQADDVYFTALILDSTGQSACAEKLLKELTAQTNQNSLKGFALLYDPNYILLYTRQEKGTTPITLTSSSQNSCFKQNKSILVPGNRTQMQKGDVGLNFRL
jgi:hypothetical protein